MKRILFATLCMIVLITGCSKDDDPENLYVFNINDLVNMIDKTPEQVKQSFKADFSKEENTLGVISLKYRMPTKDIDYNITFTSNSDNKVSKVEAYAIHYGNYSEGINFYKSESDKMNSARSYEAYMGRFSSSSAGLIDFRNRDELWQYVSEHPVSSFMYETWWIKNEASEKLTIETVFSKSSNSILIKIDKVIH